MPVVAAVAGSALVGGAMQANAASKAGKAQAAAAQQAQDTQMQMFNQNRLDQTPYRETGVSALNQLAGMYGIGDQAGQNFDQFYNSPDYQFALEQGQRSADQGLAARGISNSGAAMKELTRYGQGMASQQLGNYKQQLMAMAGMGQQATNQTGAMGQQTAQNVAQSQMGAGDARASSYQQQGQSLSNMVGTLGNTYALNSMGAFNQQPNPTQQMASFRNPLQNTGFRMMGVPQ